ncbi:hypothetical protein [Spirosoma sordidisoli]|uniref:Uncharacterized protein n=1 Tax=Spirosoma sordidisoli TaxID=2502893 RepID=A0A4Q2UM56_9BACT|nr:hypothetical protein [Spirosoma sordidisoli]RYC69832.1 hypothetical protein EQG79_14660 [Spirosoma sordidisoli]
MAAPASSFIWQDQQYAIPFGVMHSRAIRNQQGELVNFEVCSFNHFAALDLPALQNWYEGATFWELFREDARQGLFLAYDRVLASGVAHEDIYHSPTTDQDYYSLLKPWHDGVLAIGLALDRLDQLDEQGPLAPVRQPVPPLPPLSPPLVQPELKVTFLTQQLNACQRVVHRYCQTLFST